VSSMEPNTKGSSIGEKGVFEGIAEDHDFHHRNPLDVNRLSKTEALCNRQIFYIIILFLGLISVMQI